MNKKLLFFLLIPFLGFSQVQIGQDIDGEAADDWSGHSVSLSTNGKVLAIGDPHNSHGSGKNSGQVETLKMYLVIGQLLDKEFMEITRMISVVIVFLSSDGRIIVGAT